MKSIFLLAGLATSVVAGSQPEASELSKRAALDDCLRDSGVPTVTANSIGPFNKRVPYTPVAAAQPTTLGHIQAAVVCGRKAKVKITAKGGGHSYASLGLGGENGHLVINLERMNGVKLDTNTGVARVQGGARVGHVATQLYNLGRKALAHGTCPGVGIAGQALHGGYGMASHWKGLTLDAIVGATLVLADGRVYEVSADENRDLLWALRGAGSAFGVVAELKFNTFDAPSNATVFQIALNWNNEQTARNGLTAFRNFAKDTQPAELNMRLFGNAQGASLEGVYYGSTQQFNNVVQPLLKNAGGTVRSARTMGWLESLNAYANNEKLDATYPYNMQDNFYAKSLQLQDLTGTALNNFAKYWSTTARTASGGRQWWFQIDTHGGKNSAVSSVPADATSYGHRNKLFLIQFYDRVTGNNARYPDNGFDFLDAWVDTTIAPIKEDWGMYYNYADVRQTKDDALWNYWGDNAWKLQEIKELVDPDNVFYNPISIDPVKPAPAGNNNNNNNNPPKTSSAPAGKSTGKSKSNNGNNNGKNRGKSKNNNGRNGQRR